MICHSPSESFLKNPMVEGELEGQRGQRDSRTSLVKLLGSAATQPSSLDQDF